MKHSLRFIGTCAAAGTLAVLGGFVAYPGAVYDSGPVYGGASYGGATYSEPYYTAPGPAYVPPPTVFIQGGTYYDRGYNRGYYDRGRPGYDGRHWGGGPRPDRGPDRGPGWRNNGGGRPDGGDRGPSAGGPRGGGGPQAAPGPRPGPAPGAAPQAQGGGNGWQNPRYGRRANPQGND